MKAFLLEARLEKVKGISLLLQKREREQKKEERKVNWVKLQFDGEKDHSFRLMGIHYLVAANQPVGKCSSAAFVCFSDRDWIYDAIDLNGWGLH